MPDQVVAAWCGWHYSAMAGTVRAHQSFMLHGYGAPFSMVSLPTKPMGCEEHTKESSTGEGVWSRMCGGKVQASIFGDGGGTLQGSAHDKAGQNGWAVGCRTPASG
jgi:hypothetical protein